MNIHKEMMGFTRETLGLSESVPIELISLAGRGSDRDFFRLQWGQADSAILIHYNPKRMENTYYGDIAVFLRDSRVSVPRLFGHDPDRCLMLMEDMGDRDLWSFRESPWEIRRTLYRKTLIIVHRLHSFPVKAFPSDQVRLMEGFGPDLYRWERNYFKEHFVEGACGEKLDPSLEMEFEAELAALAERLSATRYSLVHRDLQSQNVMIRDGEPFLIDFQGMRFGSPFYDLGSLLCDPYVNLPEDEIDDLLAFYYVLSPWDLDWDTFRIYFWEASVQRLMQALGAYGFLGLTRGLKTFLHHIPAGLRNLHRAASHVSSLPRLLELTVRLVQCSMFNVKIKQTR
jgi:aminoglycoside/choline kinase family phosphotransferase